MNIDDIQKYKLVKNKTLSSSDVVKSSFTNVLESLKKDDYVLVENQRQRKVVVIQDIETFSQIPKIEQRFFSGAIKTYDDNILLAKTFIKENIFYLMCFESKNITFPKIESILQNVNITNGGFDAQVTHQLMNGWKLILDIPDSNITFTQILSLHSQIAKEQALEWGVLRSGNVSISGTSFSPKIVRQKDIEEMILKVRNSDDIYKEISYFIPKLIKMQPFWDGNKRTSIILANRLLIENHSGIISINNHHFEEFNNLLSNYYNDNTKLEEVALFIENNCIYNTLEKKLKR